MWEDPEHDGLGRYWKTARREEIARKKSKRKDWGKKKKKKLKSFGL
jgi:hypothetical protein